MEPLPPDRKIRLLGFGALLLALGPGLLTVALAFMVSQSPPWPHIFWGLGGWGLGLLTGLVTGLSRYQGISREFLGFLSGALIGPLLAAISIFAGLLGRNSSSAFLLEKTTEKTTVDGNTTYHWLERQTTAPEQPLPTDLTPFTFSGLFLFAYTSGAIVGIMTGAYLRIFYPGGGINIEEDTTDQGKTPTETAEKHPSAVWRNPPKNFP
ncbi:MAG: hypothetical protein M1299_08550 [Firmicutes bacterium]|nr:hypothetical protein [Bacillota bacterium]MCL5039854.1 hypothetical protein [Bacillota bacterium]